MNKGKKKLAIVITLLIAIAVAATAFLSLNPHFLYIAGEAAGVSAHKVAMEETGVDRLESHMLSELESDGRITFDQSLMLVNEEHPLAEGFAADIAEYKDSGVLMNECIIDAYAELSKDTADTTGSKLYVSSSFRTREEQEELYAEDKRTANTPDASEHQAGLGLDVYVKQFAGFGFIKTEAGQFVNSDCWQYGFIIRYPVYGKSYTGMVYEPWHIRYVGRPHAKIIYNNHITLEEYIAGLEPGAWYDAEGYLISRQAADARGSIEIPDEFENCVISEDNTGGYIITIKK